MSEKIDRNEFIKASALLASAGAMVLGGAKLAHSQEEDAKPVWEANLGKIKELNEKEPTLVKAKFFDADGVMMDEEKLYVRWEKINKNIGRWIILSAFCTHLKCIIEFDETEEIFQCPCHGSQFSLEGEVLNRPAKHPLDDYSEMVEERDEDLILKREPY